jgi:hypothetical protein
VVVHHKQMQMPQELVDKDLQAALVLHYRVTAAVEEVLEPQERLVWAQHLLRVQAVLALT